MQFLREEEEDRNVSGRMINRCTMSMLPKGYTCRKKCWNFLQIGKEDRELKEEDTNNDTFVLRTFFVSPG
jgi:hypothetical protein